MVRRIRGCFQRSGWTVAVGVVLSGLVGCGTGTYPVHGKVVFKDGKPLTGGLVIFTPTNGKLQVTARGDIQPDGTFKLGTYKEEDGALPGKYRVGITPPPRRKVREKPVEPLAIHPRYQSYETSGLEYEVGKKANDFTITVEKP